MAVSGFESFPSLGTGLHSSSLCHLSMHVSPLVSLTRLGIPRAGMVPYPQLFPKSQFSSRHILVLGGVFTVPTDWCQKTFAQHQENAGL